MNEPALPNDCWGIVLAFLETRSVILFAMAHKENLTWTHLVTRYELDLLHPYVYHNILSMTVQHGLSQLRNFTAVTRLCFVNVNVNWEKMLEDHPNVLLFAIQEAMPRLLHLEAPGNLFVIYSNAVTAWTSGVGNIIFPGIRSCKIYRNCWYLNDEKLATNRFVIMPNLETVEFEDLHLADAMLSSDNIQFLHFTKPFLTATTVAFTSLPTPLSDSVNSAQQSVMVCLLCSLVNAYPRIQRINNVFVSVNGCGEVESLTKRGVYQWLLKNVGIAVTLKIVRHCDLSYIKQIVDKYALLDNVKAIEIYEYSGQQVTDIETYCLLDMNPYVIEIMRNLSINSRILMTEERSAIAAKITPEAIEQAKRDANPAILKKCGIVR